MATIGSLAIMLKANAAPMLSGLQKAEAATKALDKAASHVFSNTRTPAEVHAGNLKHLETLLKSGRISQETYNRAVKASAKENGVASRSLASYAGALGKAGLALGGMVAGGVVALAVNGIKAARSVAQIAKAARLSHASTAGFMGLQHAIRSLGGDAETVSGAMEHLNQVLSGLGEEGQFASSLFGKFGLSLAGMAKADTYEAVKKIADAIRSTNDPLQKSTLAFAAFGERGGAMLPVLNEGSEGIQRLVDQALKMGYALDHIDAAALEKANAELNHMEDMVTGLSRQSAAQLADSFLDGAEAVKSIAAQLDSVGSIVAKVFRAFKIGWDFVLLGGLAVVGSLVLGFTKLFELVTRELARVFGLLAKLPDAMGGAKFKGIADSLQETADLTEGTIGQLKADIRREMKSITDDIDKGFGDMQRTIDQKARALDFGKKLNAGGAAPAFERYKKQLAGFANIFKENQTPLENFKNKLQEMNLFLQSTGNLDSYSRGVAKMVGELEKAHGLSEVKLAGGLERGSTAAQSAINQSDALNNRRLREKPEDRVRRVLEQSQEIEREQLEQLRRIGNALRPPQPVRIG